MARVSRKDISVLRKVERRPDGTILADALLTRCGVFVYHQPDGTERKELRLREDVANPASLKTFEGRPVTNDHPPEMLDAKNAKDFAVGALVGQTFMDDDHLRGRLSVYDADTIAQMEKGKIQTSVGYTCDLEEAPGTHPKYGKYDAIQRNIQANHLAIVDHGRAGSTHVRMDGQTIVHEDDWSDAARAASAEARKGTSTTATAKAIAASKVARETGRSADHIKASALHMAASHAAMAAGNKKAAGFHDADAEMHAKMANKAVKRGDWTGPNPEILAAESFSLFSVQEVCHTQNMAKANNVRTDDEGGTPAEGDPDPDDVASRNARGENDADPADRAESGAEGAETTDDLPEYPTMAGSLAGSGTGAKIDDDTEDPDDDPEDTGEEGDEDEPTDPYEDCMDADGDLSDDDRHKMAASSFAVPEKEGLPIHDPNHVKAAMARFGQYKFGSPDEKHAAFNRITKRAKQFGVGSDGFQKEHAAKLDRQDRKSTKYMNELKKAQADLATQTKRADSAEKALATASGQLASVKKDIEDLKKVRTDAAADVSQKIDSKVSLIVEAKKAGATVDSKMSDKAIRIAVIKHVDKLDVADASHEEYVRALYEGALTRARTDAIEIEAGAEALAAARTVVESVRQDRTEQKKDGNDEAEAARQMRARTRSAWAKTSKENN